jgi:hypothetical protein
MALIVARRSPAANGVLPTAISYSTTPSDQMSVRLSTTSPAACSGDM